MRNFIIRISRFVRRQLLKSSRYRWCVLTPATSRETIAPLLKDYSLYAAAGKLTERKADGSERPVDGDRLEANRRLRHKRVVYMCNGRTVAGGFADRLKGILSLYAISRELGYDFRISYTSPFLLEDFLPPADYDWRIAPEELGTEKAAMLVLENTEDSDFQTCKQAEWLRRTLKEGPEVMHVITNSNYAYTLDYPALFRQLFRTAPHLEAALAAEGEWLQRYVSVSARFLSMLGDFRETGENSSLPKAEAQALMQRNLEAIERLHAAHPDHTILVNSDSMRFLAFARQLPYVKVVEGSVAHTDLMAGKGAEDAHMKLFLDFFLISRADAIYMLHTPPMRISGFPYAASRLAGKEMQVIEL